MCSLAQIWSGGSRSIQGRINSASRTAHLGASVHTDSNCRRISLDGEVSAVAVRRFIDNLLPEGWALDVVSSFTHVQKSNIFGLIRVLGRETAGALSFLPAGQLPQAQEAQRRPVALAELQQRIDDRNRIPFAIWDDKVRMSVAGYQDKLLVLREGDTLFLADGSLSSTHILKPEPLNDKLSCMVANEHFCMRLVNRLGQRRLRENWAAEVEILCTCRRSGPSFAPLRTTWWPGRIFCWGRWQRFPGSAVIFF